MNLVPGDLKRFSDASRGLVLTRTSEQFADLLFDITSQPNASLALRDLKCFGDAARCLGCIHVSDQLTDLGKQFTGGS